MTSAKIDDDEIQEADLGFDPATQAELAALEARVEELEAKLAAVAYNDDANLLTISGANVRIVDGSGSTDGATNGFGNLFIGYNTDNLTGSGQGDNQTDVRTGSHNLVIGDDHTYSSYGGIVAGLNNAITGPRAAVTGGGNNTASGDRASVTGGFNNTADNLLASVTGGFSNIAHGIYASVTGDRSTWPMGSTQRSREGNSSMQQPKARP